MIWTEGFWDAKAERRVLRNSLEIFVSMGHGGWGGRRKDTLHSPTAAGPIAVVEVDAFALQDEGADAIL